MKIFYLFLTLALTLAPIGCGTAPRSRAAGPVIPATCKTMIVYPQPVDSDMGWLVADNLAAKTRSGNGHTIFVIKPQLVKSFARENPGRRPAQIARQFEAQGYILLTIKEINIPEFDDSQTRFNQSASVPVSRSSYINVQAAIHDLMDKVLWSEVVVFQDTENYFYYAAGGTDPQQLFRRHEEELQVLINGISDRIADTIGAITFQ